MEINKRVEDISQVVDRNWNVNRNNKTRREFLNNRREFLNKMHNIDEKNNRREEILRANSASGQIQNLNQRIDCMNSSQRIARMNDIKGKFR